MRVVGSQAEGMQDGGRIDDGAQDQRVLAKGRPATEPVVRDDRRGAAGVPTASPGRSRRCPAGGRARPRQRYRSRDGRRRGSRLRPSISGGDRSRPRWLTPGRTTSRTGATVATAGPSARPARRRRPGPRRGGCPPWAARRTHRGGQRADAPSTECSQAPRVAPDWVGRGERRRSYRRCRAHQTCRSVAAHAATCPDPWQRARTCRSVPGPGASAQDPWQHARTCRSMPGPAAASARRPTDGGRATLGPGWPLQGRSPVDLPLA